MIYRVCEHYCDNKIIRSSYIKPDECFICYELSTDLEMCPIRLNTQIHYNKQCRCDGWIHNQCLDKWFKNKKSCPVCRLEIYKSENNIYSVISVIAYSNRIYIVMYKTLCKIATMISYFFLMYLVIDFYLSIIHQKHIARQNCDDYNSIPYSVTTFNESELLKINL